MRLARRIVCVLTLAIAGFAASGCIAVPVRRPVYGVYYPGHYGPRGYWHPGYRAF